ncbi:hypothetical protein RND81_03G054500 [Saponaria officinalis]|uniref:Uncharacterized protein n=1 Tax=Saponaria officinalis TaxID=3572 RepID=A0AAW1M3W8_SAPOF
MDRWSGILKVPVCLKGATQCRVAASLCVSPSSKTLVVPNANAIFFNGDRVEGTGNPVIDKLSDLQNIVQVLVSKFGPFVNAWVIEASTFNGPFAVYKEFIESLNKWGEPQAYKPNGFPASTSIVSLLSNFCSEADLSINPGTYHHHVAAASSLFPPKTAILGFSKGGVVLNQLITEFSFLNNRNWEDPKQAKLSEFPRNQIIPNSTESFLDIVTEIHFVDVGLNAPGAYLTDDTTIERIAERLIERDKRMRFVLHGTPRQWNDKRRAWICEEKNKFCHLLELCAKKTEGRLDVAEMTYLVDRPPDLQMHFQIIEELVVT